MYRKQVEEHLPVHKGCSWSACSTLSPSGLDIQNTHSNTVFGKWFYSCSEASGIIAHGTSDSYLTANYLSLCCCHALWKKSSIRRCFVCHMNLQWTLQGASHCSSRHLLLLTGLNKDTWTPWRLGWDSPALSCLCLGSQSHFAVGCFMGQCCATETKHWEDGQQFQHRILCNLAVQKVPFLHGSPKWGKLVKYGAVSRLFMCKFRRKVMSSTGKGQN